MVSCFPRASCSSHLPFIVPSVAAACFWWLLCVKFSIGGRLWPRPSPSLKFFVAHLHSMPQTMGQRPPHVPPRSRLLSNAPLTVDDNFRLVAVSPHQTAAIYGQGSAHLPIFLSINSTPQTTGSRPPHSVDCSLRQHRY